MDTHTPAPSSSSSRCPMHAQAPAGAAAPVHFPSGTWPPGPPAGLTGWRLLRRMSRDLLGTLAHWQRRYGDLVHLRLWPQHALVVSDPQLVRELLVTHHEALLRWERGIQVFAQLHGHSVLIAEGDAWRSKRQALLSSFTPRAAQSFVPSIAATSADAMAQWPAQASHWPVETALTSLAMEVIVKMVFSVQIGDAARPLGQALRTVSEAANAEFYWPASWPDSMPWKRAKREALAKLKTFIGHQLQARLQLSKEAWPDDLLSRLLQLHRSDPVGWPLQAIHDECMTSFLAGHETTAATLTWWAWCMAANPAMQAMARAEVVQALGEKLPTADALAKLPYLVQTLEETLRLYPVAPVLISRRATQPITLGGWRLPTGTQFMLPVQLLHHDARWFADPQTFQPARFAADAPAIPRGAYLPFGSGPRVCLGQHLAMTEMTVVTAMLLQRFHLSVPAGMTAPVPTQNVTLRPAQALHLGITTQPMLRAETFS